MAKKKETIDLFLWPSHRFDALAGPQEIFCA